MFKKKAQGEVREIKPINPMLILACIILAAAIATYIVPAGTFERVAVEGSEYEMVVADSYQRTQKQPIGFFDLFKSLTLGLQDAAYIIFFLMILGGTFKIVEATGALHAGISNMLKLTAGKELILVPICLVMFSGISALAACCEEYLAFLPLMYMVCMACGFDSILSVAMLMCSSAIGYAGGMTNAFTVGVAQTIAGLPMFSGIGYRTIVWAVLLIPSIIYMMIYAHRITRNPEKAYNFAIDQKFRGQMDFGAIEKIEKITGRQKIILALFFGSFIFVAFSVIKWGFYIDEMAAIFLIVGILCAIVGKIKPDKTADTFLEGAKDMVWAGMIIGMCYTVTSILQNAQIMDTLVNAMGIVLKGLPQSISACGMFVLQDMLNFLIPSGSGQAAVTMPFMAPLADILGLTRQTAVLAFQLGDAFTNVVTPTSGELMAALAICHIPYNKWFKFMGPLWAIWCVIACIMLIIAAAVGYC